MCDREAVERLQAALIHYTQRRRRFSEMSRDEQTIEELCNALYMRLEHLKRCDDDPKYDSCEEHKGKMQLGDVLLSLAALSDSGILDQVLTDDNRASLKRVLSGVAKVGQAQRSLTEEALRKKDTAAYLSSSADTDLLVERHREIEDAAAKKDRR